MIHDHQSHPMENKKGPQNHLQKKNTVSSIGMNPSTTGCHWLVLNPQPLQLIYERHGSYENDRHRESSLLPAI